jgi:hypothetical protein
MNQPMLMFNIKILFLSKEVSGDETDSGSSDDGDGNGGIGSDRQLGW